MDIFSLQYVFSEEGLQEYIFGKVVYYNGNIDMGFLWCMSSDDILKYFSMGKHSKNECI